MIITLIYFDQRARAIHRIGRLALRTLDCRPMLMVGLLVRRLCLVARRRSKRLELARLASRRTPCSPLRCLSATI